MAIELSDETIQKIVDGLISKSEAFSHSESEQELRNTKTLLQNFKLLENHLTVDLPPVKDDVPLSKYELSLFALLGYRERSKEMMTFLKEVLGHYKRICQAGTFEDRRRYSVIEGLYLVDGPRTRLQLADRFNVNEKTIRRDEHQAVAELSIMIFGIDGLNDVSKTRRTPVPKSPK